MLARIFAIQARRDASLVTIIERGHNFFFQKFVQPAGFMCVPIRVVSMLLSITDCPADLR
jgi:hypothetical protein